MPQKNGDTIKVASGTYHEHVVVTKNPSIYTTKYPKVDGLEYDNGGGMLNSFTIQKGWISSIDGILVCCFRITEETYETTIITIVESP